mgnify:CR=1 FL=1
MTEDSWQGPINDKYKKFFDKFKEIETLSVASWKPVHILAYFCKKYQEQYNVNYQFKYNVPSPSNCFEIFQVKKLSNLLSSNPEILKAYIDWVFLEKAQKARRKLTSISFMTHEGVVLEYKKLLFVSVKIDRTTDLPDQYRQVLIKHGFGISTYGDLAFLYKYDHDANREVFVELVGLGFDLLILDKV